MSGKPWLKDSIEKFALAGYNYIIIGGSGSPGADDSGWSAVCKFHTQIWIYHSDPDEWYPLGEIAPEKAVKDFLEDAEYLRTHPEEYEYTEWSC